MKFIAFGITGDLMRLKILPALAGLYTRGQLEEVDIIGVSRKPWDDTHLREYIHSVIPNSDTEFLEKFSFLQGDTENPQTFSLLKERVGGEPAILYFSIVPALYKGALVQLERAEFSSNIKIMFEKPFGRSGKEAEELYEILQKVARDQNIYLVDHYLAKEWVQELKNLSNISKNVEIAEIHVRFLEEIGVETRGALYDQLGIVRDVMQNHMLQILAQVLNGEHTVKTLAQLPILTLEEVKNQAIRAQYEGYRDIVGVAPDSQTETYARISTSLGGIQIELEAGKRMPDTTKEIVVVYKNGTSETISDRKNRVGEYERILEAAFSGEGSMFVSMEEVRAQWRFIDPILTAWTGNTLPLHTYTAGQKP